MEVSVRELIRETKNAVNARFDMLEQILQTSTRSNEKVAPAHDSAVYELLNKQEEKINNLTSILYRFNDLVGNIQKKIESMEHQNAPIVTLMSGSLEKMPELHVEFTNKPQLTSRSHYDTDKEDSHVERTFKLEVNNDEAHIQTVVNEETVVEEEEAEKEEMEVEEEAEEEDAKEEEEEGVELEEFEYKGMTLYRDTENKVYRMDEENALSDPLGIWDAVKQRIRKL